MHGRHVCWEGGSNASCTSVCCEACRCLVCNSIDNYVYRLHELENKSSKNCSVTVLSEQSQHLANDISTDIDLLQTQGVLICPNMEIKQFIFCIISV